MVHWPPTIEVQWNPSSDPSSAVMVPNPRSSSKAVDLVVLSEFGRMAQVGSRRSGPSSGQSREGELDDVRRSLSLSAGMRMLTCDFSTTVSNSETTRARELQDVGAFIAGSNLHERFESVRARSS